MSSINIKDLETAQGVNKDDFIILEQYNGTKKIKARIFGDMTNQEVVEARGESNSLKERLSGLDSQLSEIENRTSDYILITPNENTNITNDILEAFKKYNNVKIKKGIYRINKINLPKDNIILDCEPGTILMMENMIGIFANNKKNITIKNLSLDGAGILDNSNVENGSTAIYFEMCNNVKIENLTTSNTGAWGIAVTNFSKNININNCICSGSIRQSGIAISGNCSNFNITNNRTYSNHYAGIIIEPNCSTGFINNNQVYDNVENGIIIVGNSNGCIDITNNIIKNNRKLGVTIIASTGINALNNTVIACGTHAIYCVDIQSNIIRNNVIIDTNKCGIYITKKNVNNMENVIITDNVVINSCLTAIEIHEASYFIRDCSELIFRNNVSKSSKKDFTLTANTYKVLEFDKCTNASQSSDVQIQLKPFSFSCKLNTTGVNIVAPYDLKIYGYKLKRKIVNSSSEQDYTLIKINEVNFGTHVNERNSIGNYIYTSHLKQMNISKGEVISMKYAHSYNNDYVSDVEIELLYY